VYCFVLIKLFIILCSAKNKTQLKLAQSVKDECNTEVTVNVGLANKIQAICCCAKTGVSICYSVYNAVDHQLSKPLFSQSENYQISE